MAISQVVAINAEGVVLGAMEYNPAAAGRDESVANAVRALAESLGIAMPGLPLNRSAEASDGNTWSRLASQPELFQPGWVEISFGKWGQES